ncbi:sugar phosphate isomerase/epimerase [Sphaerisporangium sp. TRM90804]|uniref:sugar phosphate isomerase/epimerase family protein n=1 Tax=Sphaerisporangium sp. TRM90804 TaxID=3031113 RepID=UPI0024490697|nr:sugar phosphate isomerase/epimerase [Sphaerisporangium sp. TRM90804]MDH2427486.1 sugar phosphate isomerase/epimerase [Sphaerisporangium sp. TRM90804]
MKLGFLTACLGGQSLEQVAAWASATGYDCLEVAVWPPGGAHEHNAAHLDVANFTAADAERVGELMSRYSLTIPTVTYCDNNLHADDRLRESIHRHLRSVIDTAALLGVRNVCTFIGRDVNRSVADNLKSGERHLRPLVEYAGERGVRLLAENCPMEGWHPDGYPSNLAYSPELWDWMADLGFGLTYDPSHLPWLGIDPIDALRYALRRGMVVHVQAKDIEIDERARTRYGVFGKTVGRASPTDVGWWRYRVPGRGGLDWNRVIDTLYAHGYDGTVSVEHEDPVWGGTLAKTHEGLRIAAGTLRPLIGPEAHDPGAAGPGPGGGAGW